MYKLINKNVNQEYYVNTNNTILYLYDKNLREINRIFRDKWNSMTLLVEEEKKGDKSKIEENFKNIIEEKNDFIKTVQVISSTLETTGYFEKTDNFGIKYQYLNEFLGSENFIKSKKMNKYKGRNVIDLLEKETPTINLLLRNLFHKERDEVLINFINWLNVVGFKDTNQNIIFCFFGTTQELQGQGAGKGVLVEFLKKMFSGLVCTISNKNYMNNFNSNMMNKKIVLFEEVDFKTLKYETIKEITGSSTFRVEFKGKEPIETQNVSSWLMFSNDHDLHDKIGVEDRRIFLIRPTPENGSLLRKVNSLFGDFKSFENKLYSEMENFIHIISSVPGRVKTPNELTTQGHIDYFKSKRKVSITEINNIHKVLTNLEFKKKLYDILDNIKTLDPEYSTNIEECKNIIDLGVINYKTFCRLFDYLQNFDYINSNKKLNVEWENCKEFLENNGYIVIKVDSKPTKKMNRYKDNLLVKQENYDKNKVKILEKIKKYYGIPLIQNEILEDLF